MQHGRGRVCAPISLIPASRRFARSLDVLKQTDGKGDQPGADDLVPMLVYVVLRAQPRRLHSSLQYIQRFRTASKLRGESDYYLATMVRFTFMSP